MPDRREGAPPGGPKDKDVGRLESFGDSPPEPPAPEKRWRTEPNERLLGLVHLLLERGSMRPSEIAQELSIDRAVLLKHLHALVDDGVLLERGIPPAVDLQRVGVERVAYEPTADARAWTRPGQ